MITISDYKTRADGVLIRRAVARAYLDRTTGEVYEEVPAGKVVGVDIDNYGRVHLVDTATGEVYGSTVYFVAGTAEFTMQADPPLALKKWLPNIDKISPYYPGGYPLGHVVAHCGKTYRATVDGATYAPTVYGWTEIYPWDWAVPDEIIEGVS